jgi:hypothetical protein
MAGDPPNYSGNWCARLHPVGTNEMWRGRPALFEAFCEVRFLPVRLIPLARRSASGVILVRGLTLDSLILGGRGAASGDLSTFRNRHHCRKGWGRSTRNWHGRKPGFDPTGVRRDFAAGSGSIPDSGAPQGRGLGNRAGQSGRSVEGSAPGGRFSRPVIGSYSAGSPSRNHLSRGKLPP